MICLFEGDSHTHTQTQTPPDVCLIDHQKFIVLDEASTQKKSENLNLISSSQASRSQQAGIEAIDDAKH